MATKLGSCLDLIGQRPCEMLVSKRLVLLSPRASLRHPKRQNLSSRRDPCYVRWKILYLVVVIGVDDPINFQPEKAEVPSEAHLALGHQWSGRYPSFIIRLKLSTLLYSPLSLVRCYRPCSNSLSSLHVELRLSGTR